MADGRGARMIPVTCNNCENENKIKTNQIPVQFSEQLRDLLYTLVKSAS
jgi:hypothetical protein